MKARRGHDRFIRRLETEFTAEDKNYRGISSDLSISGLFIRTQHAFTPGTLVDIVIHLPDDPEVKLKGRVMRSVKTPIVSIKNGMGIEILENDPRYINFVRSVLPDAGDEPAARGSNPDTSHQKPVHEPRSDEPPKPEFSIIACQGCGIRNKVNNAKLPLGPRCGKCGHPLTARA